jgi:hypothetical protein
LDDDGAAFKRLERRAGAFDVDTDAALDVLRFFESLAPVARFDADVRSFCRECVRISFVWIPSDCIIARLRATRASRSASYWVLSSRDDAMSTNAGVARAQTRLPASRVEPARRAVMS